MYYDHKGLDYIWEDDPAPPLCRRPRLVPGNAGIEARYIFEMLEMYYKVLELMLKAPREIGVSWINKAAKKERKAIRRTYTQPHVISLLEGALYRGIGVGLAKHESRCRKGVNRHIFRMLTASSIIFAHAVTSMSEEAIYTASRLLFGGANRREFHSQKTDLANAFAGALAVARTVRALIQSGRWEVCLPTTLEDMEMKIDLIAIPIAPEPHGLLMQIKSERGGETQCTNPSDRMFNDGAQAFVDEFRGSWIMMNVVAGGLYREQDHKLLILIERFVAEPAE